MLYFYTKSYKFCLSNGKMNNLVVASLFVKADIFLQSTSQRATHPLQQYRRTNCCCVQRKGERNVESLMETSFIDAHMKFYNLMVRKVRVCNIVTCVTYF